MIFKAFSRKIRNAGAFYAVAIAAIIVATSCVLPSEGSPGVVAVTTFAGSTGVIGSNDATGTAATFNCPRGLAVDSSGNLYVADSANNKIRTITSAGVVATLAGSGTGGWADGAGIAAEFNEQEGVAVDASGNVYVADRQNNRIRKITPVGAVSTLAGSGATGSDDGSGAAATFNWPCSVAVDASGSTIYVADTDNNLIRKITVSGGVATVSTFAGSVTPGSADGMGTAASFDGPEGLTIDSSGNLYVADIFNHKIRKITPGGLVTTFAGSGAQGSADGTGTAATFNRPANLAVDASGNLYVTDYKNNRMRKIASSGLVTTLLESGVWESANGTVAAMTFANPFGVAVDGSGNVYVAETYNHIIRKIAQ